MNTFYAWQDAVIKSYLTEQVDETETWSEGLDYWTSKDDEEEE